MDDAGLERGFVALVVVVAAALAGVTVAPTSAAAPTPEATAERPDYDAFDPVTEAGVATVGDESFDSLQRAVDAAEPGETVRISGRFDERVVVNTTGVTITTAADARAAINGGREGDVLTIRAANVTVRDVWVRNSGMDTSTNDAGVWIDAPNATVVDSRVTEITFGVWVDGVDDATLRNNTVVGRENVTPRSYRGNGIQLWKTTGTLVADNRITDARDGIYYSWASNVTARGNELWDLRYGVHYMYSHGNRLANNTAVDNDVGYALMLSERLTVVNNTAANNTGTSGHGILLKRIDYSTIRGNEFVDNQRGIYSLNSADNELRGNLVLGNEIGFHLTAGTHGEEVVNNSFVGNRRPVQAVTSDTHVWNGSERGNYWSGADAADLDDDGVSELRYRPAGLVEKLVREQPAAAVFTNSPAFEALRRAERTLPVLDAPGVVDYHPLERSPHDWRDHHARDNDD
ncbi:nitrous oxide reductase family maturation protein NosD [Halolamina sp. CBA1230]|uniref:nitrous oxide reductase family maturation protein NosD n=1 Tax=Halolamina sp. CBA1230 TaxID=1853690 RepID=UPI0009A1EEC8|nr:nitrous oxide reductase family maturation protein NosD [Halolamina sp. CBA1230]QKY19431.1 nitrous oxide reductase family maturation protein NosD [Halolamina sp. CBA1230]